jgi:predicted N-acetyltransferase YhbS
MITVRHERPSDVSAREALLNGVFGRDRFEKTSERLREGRLPAKGLSFVATTGHRLIGTVRLWHVSAGPDRPALLLGPLAVDTQSRNGGIGSALMEQAIRYSRLLGHREIFLVGDEPYYARFGFSAARTAGLYLPGPVERCRLLGLALVPEVKTKAKGLIFATGAKVQSEAPPGGTTSIGFLVDSRPLQSGHSPHHGAHSCRCGCGHVGDATALSERSVMSTAPCFRILRRRRRRRTEWCCRGLNLAALGNLSFYCSAGTRGPSGRG